jgi:hypothetical protein
MAGSHFQGVRIPRLDRNLVVVRETSHSITAKGTAAVEKSLYGQRRGWSYQSSDQRQSESRLIISTNWHKNLGAASCTNPSRYLPDSFASKSPEFLLTALEALPKLR